MCILVGVFSFINVLCNQNIAKLILQFESELEVGKRDTNYFKIREEINKYMYYAILILINFGKVFQLRRKTYLVLHQEECREE